MAGKKQVPAKQNDPIEDDDDNWEEAVVDSDSKDGETAPDLRMRDWRDVERYREMKQLKDLVDDDSGIAEIFQPPPRKPAPVKPAKGAKLPKQAAAAPAPAPAKPGKGEPAKAVPAKAVAAKPAAKAAKAGAKPAAKAATKPAARAAKAVRKAKKK